MKKIIITIISLLLALFLLCGCAADAVSTAIVFQQQPEAEPEMLCFEDIKYIRPDLDGMYATVDALHTALENPFKVKQIIEYLDTFFADCSNFDTMYTVANIRAYMNVHDEFYDEEYEWCMAAYAEKQILFEEVMEACADSFHSIWLNRLYFGTEYEIEDEQAHGSYEDYLELVERNTELVGRYRDIAAERSELGDYEKYNPILAELYIEFIELHREYADFMEYDSYAELAYEVEYEREYSPDEALEYMSYVKDYLAKLRQELYTQGLAETLIYDPVDERELELYLETVAWGFGGKIEEAWRFMKEYNMYDFTKSSDKAESSFQVYLTDYNAPYLFLYPYGDTSDISTMCHEFGHYVDAYIRENAYESIDLAEVYSQAMEFLSLDQLRCIMIEEEFSSYNAMSMLEILDVFVGQSALAEFEIRAHEMENPTVEKLNQLCLEISKDYGLYFPGEDMYYSMYWVDISHLFESPFYVISYAVSAAAALELYEMELDEDGSGVESFILMSESRIATLLEALEYAGLEDPLSEKRVRQTAEFIRSQLPA